MELWNHGARTDPGPSTEVERVTTKSFTQNVGTAFNYLSNFIDTLLK